MICNNKLANNIRDEDEREIMRKKDRINKKLNKRLLKETKQIMENVMNRRLYNESEIADLFQANIIDKFTAAYPEFFSPEEYGCYYGHGQIYFQIGEDLESYMDSVEWLCEVNGFYSGSQEIKEILEGIYQEYERLKKYLK